MPNKRPQNGRSSACSQIHLAGHHGYSGTSEMRLAQKELAEDEMEIKKRQSMPHPHGKDSENPYYPASLNYK
jgi:hypothetical protein